MSKEHGGRMLARTMASNVSLSRLHEHAPPPRRPTLHVTRTAHARASTIATPRAPTISAADINAAAAGLPAHVDTAMRLKYQRSGSEYTISNFARLWLRVGDLAEAEQWALPRGADLIRRMSRLAVLEVQYPHDYGNLKARAAALELSPTVFNDWFADYYARILLIAIGFAPDIDAAMMSLPGGYSTAGIKLFEKLGQIALERACRERWRLPKGGDLLARMCTLAILELGNPRGYNNNRKRAAKLGMSQPTWRGYRGYYNAIYNELDQLADRGARRVSSKLR